jgi:hypothetical protein
MSEKSSNKDTGAGKGDKPRNCFSRNYRDNYDSINWAHEKDEEKNTISNDIAPPPKRKLSANK